MKLDFIKSLLEAQQARTASDANPSDDSDKVEKKVPAGKKDTTPDSAASNPNKTLPPVKGKNTMTGEKANEVDVEPGIYPEEIKEGDTAVVAFGRFNPPSVGHEQLVGLVEYFAKESRGTPMVFLSRTHDSKKNPMMYESKLAYARYAFGDIIQETPEDSNDPLKIATLMYEDGYTNLIFVAGSDRVAEYERKLNQYNGNLYEFENIIVQSAGERDPDSVDHITGASASKLREAAAENDFGLFKAGLPRKLRCFAEQIYAEVRGELNELNTQQRAKRAILFKRNKTRVKLGRDRALKRRAPSRALMKRSRRLAIKMMRKRVLRGQNYQDLSYAQRSTVDARLKKRKKSIGKIAKRLLPKVARAEASRKLGGRFVNPMKGKVNEQLMEMINFIPEAEYDYELSEKEVVALQEKADESGYSYETIETVFRRGVHHWQLIESDMTFSQYGFARVNSFIHEGKAYDLDFDLVVEDCENYASTKDDEEDADHDGDIDRAERGAIDLRAKERQITTMPATGGFHRHNRDSVVHRDQSTPGKQKHAALVKKVFEMVHPELRGRIKDDSKEIPNLDDGLGKNRYHLPQLTNFDAFHKDLTDSGHQLGHDYVVPKTLTPTQKHFNQEKVDKLKANGWGDKGIIVSKDNYVIDGHHRWLAAHQKGEKIKARVTSLKCDELLDFLKGKDYVEKKTLDEEAN